MAIRYERLGTGPQYRDLLIADTEAELQAATPATEIAEGHALDTGIVFHWTKARGTWKSGPFTVDPVTGDVQLGGAVMAANTPGGVIVPGVAPRRSLKRVGVVVAASPLTRALVESPCIWSDPDTGKLKMAYSAYDQTSGVATQVVSIWSCESNDGIVWNNHTQFFTASGVAGSPDEKGVGGPVVMRDPATGIWCMFYIGLTAVGYEGGTPSLCLATATTPAGPWTRLGRILGPGGTGWRQNKVWHGYPVKWLGTWYIFINATDGPGDERVGLAQSSGDLTGPWSWRDDVSPLLPDQADLATFFLQSGDPCVTIDEASGIVRMDASHCSASAGGDQYWETTAKEFPVGWVLRGYSINSTDSDATYDTKYAAKPWIQKINGKTYHYYTAVSNVSGRQIALAIDAGETLPTPAPVVGNQLDSGFAKSLYQQLVAAGVLVDKSVQVSTLTLSDQFARADAALNGSNAVVGGVWTAAAGFDIASNALVWSGAVDGNATLAITMPTDFYAVFDFAAIAAASYPVGFWVGNPAGVYLKIYWNGSPTSGGWKCSANSGTTVTTVKSTAKPMGTSGRIEIVKRGQSIILRYNGDYSEFTFSNSPAGKLGLAASGTKGFTLTNLQLWI